MGNRHEKTNEKRTLNDKLKAVVLLESSKNYKEMDDALISECVDFLMEIEEKKRILKTEIDQSVEKISFVDKVHNIGMNSKTRFRLKTLGIIAAVLAVIFSIFAIAAVGSGDESDILVNKWIRVIDELIEGEILNFGDKVTFTKAKEKRTYSSIEELLTEEDIAVLYPSWLPEDVKVKSVDYFVDSYTGERVYTFITDNVVYNIVINLDKEVSSGMKTDFNMKVINGLEVYYKYYDTTVFWQANFDYNGMMYSLSAYTEEELLKIIENLKEIE
ncbi:MAG: hypothetical protein IJD49_06055 [Clostridia bacterium]|nr:hypothetical protein [Clostridia bacterium]